MKLRYQHCNNGRYLHQTSNIIDSAVKTVRHLEKHRLLPLTWIGDGTVRRSQNTNPHTQTYEFQLVNMIFSHWEF